MENELVKKTNKLCEDIYKALVEKHGELKKNGAHVSILNEIVGDINALNEIVANVNNENAEEYYKKAIDLETVTNFKYFDPEKEVPELVEVPEKEEGTKRVLTKEEIEEEDEKKSNAGKVVAGVLATVLGTGLVYHSGAIVKEVKDLFRSDTETVEESEANVRISTSVLNALRGNRSNNNTSSTTPETTAAPTETPASTTTPETTAAPTETPEATTTTETTAAPTETPKEETASTEKQLVLGEYGTFFDVTDKAQVEARAQYILDTYYAPFMDQLSENEREFLNVETIANIIRVMNGELPIDENGNVIEDANVVDNYGQKYTVIVGDLGSSPKLEGRLYNIPSHMFTIDGSRMSEFLKPYDEAYQLMVDGNNQAIDQRLAGEEVTGATILRQGIADWGTKVWYEWVMQGVFGDTNPYNIDAKDRLDIFMGTFVKYGQYAYEYNSNSLQPVCVTVCVNEETKEMMEIPVNAIYEGYISGVWDTVIAKKAGFEVPAIPDSIAFTQDLMDELTWKYNNLYQRGL